VALKADQREWHIGGDFLQIYRLEGNAIIFVHSGSHSNLFEEGSAKIKRTRCRTFAPAER
jgi:hypothetical protein